MYGWMGVSGLGLMFVGFSRFDFGIAWCFGVLATECLLVLGCV